RRPVLLLLGIVPAAVGILLLAPVAVAAAATAVRRAPVAARLALRDLGRYQARAGAALGAITLALAIASTISVSAAYHTASQGPTTQNLPDNELVVYLGSKDLVP